MFKNKILRFFFPIPSIIILMIYGVLIAFSTTTDGEMTFQLWIYFMLIIFLFLVLPIDVICWKRRKRIQYNKDKETAKTRSIILLNEAKRLANTINTTIDEYEFFESYSKVIKIFEELCTYEKYKFLTGQSPQANLAEIKGKQQIATEDFWKRRNSNLSKSISKSSPHLADFDSMDGHDFEHFCADILRKNGFTNVEVTQGSGDHGIDILAEKDDITYAIQCKCYSSNIGNAAVQQAFTGKKLYKKDVAVVLTNQYFTQQAKDEASELGVKLWDRDRLNSFINNTNS